MSKNFCRV